MPQVRAGLRPAQAAGRVGPCCPPLALVRGLVPDPTCALPSPQRTAVTTIIETLLKEVAIEEHLERTEPDFVSRWENVLELVRRLPVGRDSGLQVGLADSCTGPLRTAETVRCVDGAQPRGCAGQGAEGVGARRATRARQSARVHEAAPALPAADVPRQRRHRGDRRRRRIGACRIFLLVSCASLTCSLTDPCSACS